MILTLAAIEGTAIIGALIWLLIMGVIFWLLHWLITYVGLPEPFAKVAYVILAIAAVVIVINVLLSIAGKPFIRW